MQLLSAKKPIHTFRLTNDDVVEGGEDTSLMNSIYNIEEFDHRIPVLVMNPCEMTYRNTFRLRDSSLFASSEEQDKIISDNLNVS